MIKPYKLRPETGTRDSRMWNIAAHVINNWPGWSDKGNKAISIRRVRDEILKVIGKNLPDRDCNDKQLRDQRLGDDKAHGDAMGGHGFKLTMSKVWTPNGYIKAMDFTNQNYDILMAYLKGSGDGSDTIQTSIGPVLV